MFTAPMKYDFDLMLTPVQAYNICLSTFLEDVFSTVFASKIKQIKIEYILLKSCINNNFYICV